MERDRAWPTTLLKSTNIASPSLCSGSGLFPLLMEKTPDRGGKADGFKGSQALGHSCEQSDLGTKLDAW